MRTDAGKADNAKKVPENSRDSPLRDGELLAVDSVNTPKDQLAARKLIPARVRPDRTRLADPGVPLPQAC